MKWFKHDTDSLRNRKIRKVIRVHGAAGYAVWWAIVEEVYKTERKGFQIEFTSTWLKRFAKELNSDPGGLFSVIETLATYGLIDDIAWRSQIIRLNENGDVHQPGPIVDDVYRAYADEVFKRDGFRCVYCGSTENLTLDHVIPKSKNGSHKPSNLACACRSCNSRKGARTPEQWLGGSK